MATEAETVSEGHPDGDRVGHQPRRLRRFGAAFVGSLPVD
jgi:hypothetical protein